MKKLLKLIGVLIIFILILQPNVNLIAQDISGDDWDMIEGAGLNINGVKNGELANCFDAYNIPNIYVSVGLNKSSYKPSDIVEVRGSISNNNPYPIIDTAINVRILRAHPNPVDKSVKYITVDDQIIRKNITLKSNDKYSFDFNYFLPTNAPSGEYMVQYYIYNQDRFNLAGLSFTGDIIGNTTTFNVEGVGQHIYLDNTNITIDGKKYESDSMEAMLQVEGNKTIPIKIPLVNPESISKNMEVNYKLYKSDYLLGSNLLEEKSQQVTVPANGKIDLEYSIETSTDPVYYIVITSNALGELETDAIRTKTMSDIRFSVEGENTPKINWVGLDKYPFQEGEEVKLVTCLSNVLYKIDKNEFKFKSIVKDSKGKELTKIEYEGEIVPSIRGLMNKFIATNNNNINKITIETSLYNSNDEMIDSITTIYDCNELSPELCNKDKSTTSNIFSDNRNTLYIIAIVLGVIFISTGIIIVKKYNKIKQ
jgi:hypothetical protein